MTRAPALDGLLVLDLTPSLPGQLCCSMLGDLGARLVRIDRPGASRFDAVDRHRERLVLDLREPAGRERLHALAADADVVVEGFRPGVAARLGAGADELLGLNPRLVHCSLSAYGQTGPLRDLPGHEKNFLGLAGVLSTIGEPGRPEARIGVSIADTIAALAASTAILAALRARDRDGRGQSIDLALADCCYLLATTRLFDTLVAGLPPSAVWDRPGMGMYDAGDGRALTVAAVSEAERSRLDELTGGDPAAAFRSAPRAEWLARLAEAGVSSGPVNTLEEAAADPHAAARGVLRWVETDAVRVPRVLFPALLSETPVK